MRLALAASLLVAAAACSRPAAPVDDGALRRAAEAHDLAAFEADLKALETWLRAEFPVAAAQLRPGLTDAQIDERLRRAGAAFDLPLEVRALYRWHDGMGVDGDLPLLEYHRFVSLEEALRGPGAFMPLPGNALMLFAYPEEAYYVLCPTDGVPAAPVHFRLLEDPDPVRAYTSVQTMIATALECYRSGAVTPGGAGWNVEDQAAFAEIHARRNPGATYPYALP